MSYLETLETRELLLMANNLLAEYNKTRECFENKARQYGRQAITNNYHKEEDLVDLLDDCATLKFRYNEINAILSARGERNPCTGWNHNNDDLFVAKEVLHAT